MNSMHMMRYCCCCCIRHLVCETVYLNQATNSKTKKAPKYNWYEWSPVAIAVPGLNSQSEDPVLELGLQIDCHFGIPNKHSYA